MPRASRYLLQGYTYHLTQRCTDREFLLRFGSAEDIGAVAMLMDLIAGGHGPAVQPRKGRSGAYEYRYTGTRILVQ